MKAESNFVKKKKFEYLPLKDWQRRQTNTQKTKGFSEPFVDPIVAHLVLAVNCELGTKTYNNTSMKKCRAIFNW